MKLITDLHNQLMLIQSQKFVNWLFNLKVKY